MKHGSLKLSSLLLISLCGSAVASTNMQTSEVALKVNLPSTASTLNADFFSPQQSGTYHYDTSFTVFDSSGTSHTQTFYFLKVSATDWLVATSVDGVMVDFQTGAGTDIDAKTSNSVGSGSSIRGTIGYTAGRLIFAADGSLTSITAGDGLSITSNSLNQLETESFGTGIITNGADDTQSIKLDFNLGGLATLEPTHFAEDFAVWHRERNGSTAKLVSVSISPIDGGLNTATPVAINNESEVVLNKDGHGVYWKAGTSPVILASQGTLQVPAADINDSGLILGINTDNPDYLNYWESKNGSLKRILTTPERINALALSNNNMLGVVYDEDVNNVNNNHTLGAVQLTPDNINPTYEVVSTTSVNTNLGTGRTLVSGLTNWIAGIAHDGSYFGNITGNVYRPGVANSCDPHLQSSSSYYADITTYVDAATGVHTDVTGSLSSGTSREYINYVYSTPDGSEILWAYPGQQKKRFTHANGSTSFEDTFCRTVWIDDMCTVNGASFDTLGEPDKACQFDVFNTNIGYGRMEADGFEDLGEFRFVMVGMTDPALDDAAIGLSHDQLQLLSDVLTGDSTLWEITSIIDINENGEAIGKGRYDGGTDVPIILKASVGQAPDFIGVAQTTNPAELEVSWTNIPGATFEVYDITNGDVYRDISGGSFVVSGLSGLTTFRVKACTATGCSGLSEPISGIPLVDNDNDGLSDNYEISIGTDPQNPDSDGDGLLDGEEIATGTDPLDSDSDNDGLSDGDEVNTHGTNPLNVDTDGDGLSDYDEINVHGTNPLLTDTDGDGVNDNDEIQAGTNPNLADTDGDGLNDGDELTQGTDPLITDSDADGLNDGDEISFGTNPLNTDSDSDGLSDGDEVNVHTTAPLNSDTDGDGLSDYDEIFVHGTNPLLADEDSDGLNDNQEITLGTNPSVADTDGDGLNDGAEVSLGTDPLVTDSDGDGLTDGEEVNSHGTNPLVVDTDGDGLSDYAEINVHGTNPLLVDTDGDGLSDSLEISIGTNPLMADSDGDGLSDSEEVNTTGTDPTLVDTDSDGLSDYDEINVHGTDPLVADGDDDGLSDGDEINIYGTDPALTDTDGDGVDDGTEVNNGSNPLSADSDGDGLSDFDEINTHGTNPASSDTDGDGLSDYDEINVHGTNPLVADTDGDGLNDNEEIQAGTSPTNEDTDGDGLPDGLEIDNGFDPTVIDTDGDGVSDYDEYHQNLVWVPIKMGGITIFIQVYVAP